MESFVHSIGLRKERPTLSLVSPVWAAPANPRAVASFIDGEPYMIVQPQQESPPSSESLD